MKRIALILWMIIAFFNANSQIKIWDDNRVSIATLNREMGVQILPNAVVGFHPVRQEDYAWMNLTYVPNLLSKCWIVVDPNGVDHNFFVYGNGEVYSSGCVVRADTAMMGSVDNIDDAIEKIGELRGVSFRSKSSILYGDSGRDSHMIDESHDSTLINSIYLKDLQNQQNSGYFGVVAEEVEKVIPEVVRTFPDGRKGVLYEGIVSLLIEAIKSQESKISDQKVELVKQKEITRSLIERVDILSNQINNMQVAMKHPTAQLNNVYSNQFLIDETEMGNTNTETTSFLFQNKPNPFSEKTTIEFNIAEGAQKSSILLFNAQGFLLKTYDFFKTGKSEIIIPESELAAGLYIYSLIVDGIEVSTKKMFKTTE